MQKIINDLKYMAACLALTFLVQTQGQSYAQELSLPIPGTRVHLSTASNPPILKGIKIDPANPFKFEFILDKGGSLSSPNVLVGDLVHSNELDARQKHSGMTNEQLKQESVKLIKYFLASLTIPEQDLWVNLSPYEKNRIIPDAFGQTEMGRDLLAQDYMLKQITASLMYPEGETGKEFWKQVYEKAAKTCLPTGRNLAEHIIINTFNKVWIVPEKAVVYESAKAGTAYVVESKLKVMLEEDYLALNKNRGGGIHDVASQIIREVIIPQLTKEINQGQNFAQLRQVYNSLILGQWYKKKIKESILNQVYSDKNKVHGITYYHLSLTTDTIYKNYLMAFKKGAYNFIKEEKSLDCLDTNQNCQPIVRKYFSGGASLQVTKVMSISDAASIAEIKPVNNVVTFQVNINAAMIHEKDKREKPEKSFVWGAINDLSEDERRDYINQGKRIIEEYNGGRTNNIRDRILESIRQQGGKRSVAMQYVQVEGKSRNVKHVEFALGFLEKDRVPAINYLIGLGQLLNLNILAMLRFGFYLKYGKEIKEKDKLLLYLVRWSYWCRENKNTDGQMERIENEIKSMPSERRKECIETALSALGYNAESIEPLGLHIEEFLRLRERSRRVKEVRQVESVRGFPWGQIKRLDEEERDELINKGRAVIAEYNKKEIKRLKVLVDDAVGRYKNVANISQEFLWQSDQSSSISTLNAQIGALISSAIPPPLYVLRGFGQLTQMRQEDILKLGFYLQYKVLFEQKTPELIYLILWSEWVQGNKWRVGINLSPLIKEIHALLKMEGEERYKRIAALLQERHYSDASIENYFDPAMTGAVFQQEILDSLSPGNALEQIDEAESGEVQIVSNTPSGDLEVSFNNLLIDAEKYGKAVGVVHGLVIEIFSRHPGENIDDADFVPNPGFLPDSLFMVQLMWSAKFSGRSLYGAIDDAGRSQSIWKKLMRLAANITTVPFMPYISWNQKKIEYNRLRLMNSNRIVKVRPLNVQERIAISHDRDLGGIDLSFDKALTVKNSGQGIKFHMDSAQIAEWQNVPGVTFEIFGFKPMTDVRSWLASG